jgi:hypothetical protein
LFTHFNHSQFRRYLLAFGSLFSRVTLSRTQGTAEVQRMVVPLDYGPKEKWFVRLTQDRDLGKGVAVILPRMSYELSGVSYDGSRKLNTMNHMSFATDEQRKLARMYVGVPYTLNFELSILTKLQQDGLQIVEQIFPYFTPDLTMALLVIPELGLTDQVPITITSSTHSDSYEGDFETRRAVVWNLGFSMKVNFYGPRRKQSRIEEIFVDIYNSPLNDLIDPPEYLASEAAPTELLLSEDDSGHIADESTANTYLTTGRVARVHVAAVPQDQQPVSKDDIDAVTTLTEYDGDIKRTYDITGDEDV